MSRAFAAFPDHLEGQPRSTDADTDLEAMGRAHFEYAFTHPLQYQLMFGTGLPDPKSHPDRMRNARHAFQLLQSGIEALHQALNYPKSESRRDFDALLV